MSDDQIDQISDENEPEFPVEPAPEAPHPDADRVHVIKCSHVPNFLGPFPNRRAAENYIDAKRSRASDDKWNPQHIRLVTAEQAQREKDEERARELTGR